MSYELVSRAEASAAVVGAYEEGLVAIFADLSELFGNPRSYGQIYGLLLAHEESMKMEEIARQLNIRQSSISQGLRQFEAFGTVVK